MPDGSEWSEWILLNGLSVKDIPRAPGAYVIAIRSPIHRVAGSDPLGISDIGESTDPRTRTASFIGCATGRYKEGHMAGWRCRSFKMTENFLFEKLWIRWATTNTKEEAYRIEGSLFESYLQKYKELAPLNYKFNWSKYAP